MGRWGGGGGTSDLKLGGDSSITKSLFYRKKLGGGGSRGPSGSAVPGIKPRGFQAFVAVVETTNPADREK